jgi:tetratricopeptide (TPR) repeat protein
MQTDALAFKIYDYYFLKRKRGENHMSWWKPHRYNERVHNIPYFAIGSLLKGRDDALDTLHKRLTPATAAAITQPQVIIGLGGIGKTRLAIEYALQSFNKKHFKQVFFVNADSSISINTNLAALAAQEWLALPESEQPDQSITLKAVLRWLASHKGWLLILDNVDIPDSQERVMQIIPRLSLGRVIITSRFNNWPVEISCISIDKLTTNDSVDYLLQTTQDKRTFSKDDDKFVTQLADNLDGLPIALEQAAAYISHKRISFQEYLDEFESSKKHVLSWHDEKLIGSYHLPVLAVWQSSEKQLSASARAILRIVSLLSPEPIPCRLFESQPDKINNAAELLFKAAPVSLKIKDLLPELADYSLIKFSQSSFTIHRLTQDAVRLSMTDSELKSWTKVALELVKNFVCHEDLLPDDIRSWYIWKPIAPHLSTLLRYRNCPEIPVLTGYLCNSLGRYLSALARFKEASLFLRRSLKIDEKFYGHNHSNVAASLNNLAGLLRSTNHLSDAEPLIRRAIKIFEDSLGPNHSNVATALNNLAELLQETNRLEEAESLYRRVIQIDEKYLDLDDPKVAIHFNNLADLLRDTDRLEEAESLYRRSLKIDERVFYHDHPKVAIRLSNLAGLLRIAKRFEEAEQYYRRALDISEKSPL